MRFRAVTFSSFPGSLVHQRCRSTEFVSLSWSHCNVPLSPAGTQGSEQLDPVPARAATASPCPAPGAHVSTKAGINQRTTRETAAEQTASPDVRSRHKARSRACGTPARGRCDRDSEKGEGPAGSRDGCSGHPQQRARAGRSCPLQTPPAGPRDSKTSRVMSMLSLLLSSPSRSPASIQLH